MKNYDAIVIGGGIVGSSTAYHLARENARTLLIDRNDAGRATFAGAGILSAATGGTSIDPAWFHFAVHCMDYYPDLIEQLHAEQADDTGYAICGKLTVAVSADEIEPYEQAKAIIFARQQQRGFPAQEDLHEISSDDACELFPLLAPTLRALYYRGAARVDGNLLNNALRAAARKYGLKEESASAEKLIVENNTLKGVVANGMTYSSDKVILAGGAWSVPFSEQLGITIPVAPQRGQIMHFSLPDTRTNNLPVVNTFHGHYLVAWEDNRIVAGATRESGSGFNPATSATGMTEVLQEALRVAPGLANAQFKEIRVGLRPATIDQLPVLGTIPGINGIYMATGHGASGLQLGPFSGKLAAEWAIGHDNLIDISAFQVGRFL